MSYRVIFKPSAEKEFARLPQPVYEAVARKLIALQEHPRPSGVKKLRGREGYRVRVGQYRIIYRIDDQDEHVTILAIAHRRDVYR